ncbi:inositol monophosphatase family protein [Salibacterium qingdaonense]|uniref:Myo-inositol-1(Or 4)-monophosphatase n=1 Tax=Salibacterium qingdaonense TaxID=266892 RepID=A0A1I4ISQ4_9BACI|nr:inositol monophosphatase [Salibacterium qingdaonense]SFL57382.1 myo-inositol-1(or 4)-monophosphatase [Salibacterium qingdaonense]
MNENWNNVKNEAVKWVEEAGKILKESLYEQLDIQTKSNPNDLVTEMDYKVERILKERIEHSHPDHKIIGEEEAGRHIQSTDGVMWLIDPIDGTTNFVHQKFNFAISVAVVENGVGKIGIIYNVIQDEWFTAVAGQGAFLNERKLEQTKPVTLQEAVLGLNGRWLAREKRADEQSLHHMVRRSRSVRSYGAAAIELAYVACGRLDCYISFRLSPWDYAAGLVLLKETGHQVSTFQNDEVPLLEPCRIAASRPGLHEELLDYLYDHKGFEY